MFLSSMDAQVCYSTLYLHCLIRAFNPFRCRYPSTLALERRPQGTGCYRGGVFDAVMAACWKLWYIYAVAAFAVDV